MEKIEITEQEWRQLSDNWPPVVEREDGSLLAITGKWSTDKRHYAYATVEVSGLQPSAVGPEICQVVGRATGSDVEDFREDAHANQFDGTYAAAAESRITVWWVSPNTPVRLKAGDTYTSSGDKKYGDAHVHFYGGPASAPAYRSQSQQFQATHQAALNVPQPPSPKQIEILQKYVERAKSWGIREIYRVPDTAAGAKRVLDTLSANGWRLKGEFSGPDPLSTWSSVLSHEKREREKRESSSPKSPSSTIDYEPGE